MVVNLASLTPLRPGDILYHAHNATYLINNKKEYMLKVISASEFTAIQWEFLKNLGLSSEDNLTEL